MPIGDLIGADVSGFAKVGLNIAILVISIAAMGGLAWLGIYIYRNWVRYKQYKCVIWEVETDSDPPRIIRETQDSAGIFVDKKTKNKLFFMKKSNVAMSPDRIPYIPSGRDKIVYMLRFGLKNFVFVRPNFGSNPGLSFIVGEEDVNQAINEFDRYKRMLYNNPLLQYMPFILLAFVSIIILVIFIYFFKDFAVLRDVASALREAAHEIAQAKAGTLVIE